MRVEGGKLRPDVMEECEIAEPCCVGLENSESVWLP